MHILDLTGKRIKSYKPHLASIVDIEFDETGDFIATASIDGELLFTSKQLVPTLILFIPTRPDIRSLPNNLRILYLQPQAAHAFYRSRTLICLQTIHTCLCRGWPFRKPRSLRQRLARPPGNCDQLERRADMAGPVDRWYDNRQRRVHCVG